MSETPRQPPMAIALIASPALSMLAFSSGIFSLFAPIPLIWVAFSHGWNWALALAGISSLLLGLAFGPGIGLLHVLTVALTLSVLRTVFRKNLSLANSFFMQIFVGTALITAGVTVMGLSEGMAPWDWLLKFAEQSFESAKPWHEEMVKQGKMPKDSQWAALLKDPKVTAEMIVREFFPFCVLLTSIFFWFSALFADSVSLKTLGSRLWSVSEWTEWKSPDHLVWVAIGLGATLLLAHPDYPTLTWVVKWISTPALEILFLVYFFHGASVLAFFFRHFKVLPFLRVAISTAVFFFLTPALVAVGFFDLWWDLRRRVLDREKEG